jgi:hypothetical protein
MHRIIFAVGLVITTPSVLLAQTEAVTSVPPNIVVPNYNGVPIGPFGGLEASAYTARATDASAAWFNPAGLSRSTGAQITGSAGLYQLTSVSPKSFPDSGGSVQQVPNLVGFTVASHNLTAGFAILTTTAWEQETDTENIDTIAGSPSRFAYSADSSVQRRVAAFSVGYDPGRAWRVGGGLAFSFTSIRMVQTTSQRIADPTMLRTLLVSSRASGSTLQLRPIVGVQLTPSPTIRIGGVIRTPGFALFNNGSLTLDATRDTGGPGSGVSFFDPDADFDYKLPFEGGGGVAIIHPRVQVEFDALAYSGASPYPLIASSETIAVYQDAGTGTPPTVTQLPFSGLTTAAKAIANVSVGGHYQVFENRPMQLHFGVASDFSPVAEEDRVFDRVDLVTWTIGVSGSAGKLTYAAGFNYRGGTTDTVVLRNVLTGAPIETQVGVRTIGMIYSLAYQF